MISKNKKDYEMLIKMIRIIEDVDGTIVGRAGIFADEKYYLSHVNGIVSVDGFETSGLSGIVGVLKGKTSKASRDVAIPVISNEALNKWASEQSKLIISLGCPDHKQLLFSSYICQLLTERNDLKIARWKNKYVSYFDIIKIVKNQSFNQYYLVQDAAIYLYEKRGSKNITFSDNVFICEMGLMCIFQSGRNYYYNGKWPNTIEKVKYRRCNNIIESQIIEVISIAKGMPFEKIIENVRFSTDEVIENAVVENVEGEKISFNVDVVNLENLR